MSNLNNVDCEFLNAVFGEHSSASHFERFERLEQIVSIIKTLIEGGTTTTLTGALLPAPLVGEIVELNGSILSFETTDPTASEIPVSTLCAAFFTYDSSQGVFFSSVVGRTLPTLSGGATRIGIRLPFSIDTLQSRQSPRVKISKPNWASAKVTLAGISHDVEVLEVGTGGCRFRLIDPKTWYGNVSDDVMLEIMSGDVRYEAGGQIRWIRGDEFGTCFEHLLGESPCEPPLGVKRLLNRIKALAEERAA